MISDDFQPIAGHPLACSFEQSLCSWSQSTADNFDWSLRKGPTPSSDTGPWADHTTGSGKLKFSSDVHNMRMVESIVSVELSLHFGN